MKSPAMVPGRPPAVPPSATTPEKTQPGGRRHKFPDQPRQVVTRDLWKDFGDCTVTGIAPTAMGGPALFDAIELLRENPE